MIDTHAHLTDSQFESDLQNLVQSAFSAGVSKIVTVATQLEDSQKCIGLSRMFRQVYATVGIHPHEAHTWNEESAEIISNYSKTCIAIGEIGLDYFYQFSPHALQREVFINQMELARRLNKPVIIHCRDAFDDLKRIIHSFPAANPGGVIHCYTGNIDDAFELVEHGYYLSFGGMLTFKRAESIRLIALKMPLDRILLETDSPYLSPEPIRGKRNTPQNIRLIYQSLADLRKIPLEVLQMAIASNVMACFKCLAFD